VIEVGATNSSVVSTFNIQGIARGCFMLTVFGTVLGSGFDSPRDNAQDILKRERERVCVCDGAGGEERGVKVRALFKPRSSRGR
jgi:hypothetical protein